MTDTFGTPPPTEDRERPLWTPSATRAAGSRMRAFAESVAQHHDVDVTDSTALHRFSVDHPGAFWSEVWDFCDVVGERGERAIADAHLLPGARFFPDARLNVAENLLRRSDDAPALIVAPEGGARAEWSWKRLHDEVSRTVGVLRDAGVTPGDRVAAWMPNIAETYVTMLAAAAVGATFTSTSPDFGVDGVLDRFGQTTPTVLVAADGYRYGSKTFDCTAKLAAITAALPSLRRVLVVPFLSDATTGPGAARPDIGDALWWDEALATQPGGPIDFARLPFDHPWYILYSSGTTGVPKCIVHSAGGVLLQHLKEHRLHCDVRAGDRMFHFTTAGWMMWNWLASGLASEATLVLYDGSPAVDDGRILWDLVRDERVTLFGTSAKWIDACAKAGLEPVRTHDLAALRTITSTGSPLAHESFDWIYDAVKTDVHLASISGGTDICGCFVLGDPTRPVWRGEIQAAGLGMAVDVVDDDGAPIREPGVRGDLVCTLPAPSMPVGFWNDPDGTRFHDAYFARFAGVWTHGDFVSRTDHDGWIIHGRSDATLNPGGVRIGTAELYRQVDRFDEVVECLAIGQDHDGDSRVVLFVRLSDGVALTDDLQARVRTAIRTGCSPRHVPAVIVAVDDLPRTRSGKLAELAVADVVAGRPVRNTGALANPECLDAFRDLPALRD